ncbi:heterogeneous nuclear ribonucleoprotein HRP1 [Plectosphaerella cucumerina]|uniref:Heterogeneous nuclear ribonucleoprotein HRP1 n=1 Tax=Plectosphaerella cucumerina TaxID=40658 RepID=A0A8K0TE80_9PEZI|nr:heterogeneous nuclear ribonucleoprotein HRP1 [Plectosphaerella cucumerina]
MADNDNFEEDLFADLYDDDTSAAKPEPAAPAPAAAPVAAAPPALETSAAPQAAAPQQEQADSGDYDPNQGYDEEEDDDEVDFNLGGGSNSAPPPPSNGGGHNQGHGHGHGVPHEEPAHYSRSSVKNPSAKEDGKMFIGGLNWETTDESLRAYFSQFGEVLECTVMRDNNTGRSRGFGFLTFKDAKTVNIVMVKEHFLDGKIIDPKRAIPRDEQEKTSKIFVGGVSQETTDQEFKDYFAQFGRVVDATLMMDKDTGRPRGFGFVTFENEDGVEACLRTNLEIHGKAIEVKKAQPRGNLREEEEAARRGGKFRKDDGNPQGGMNNQMGGGAGGMTPQVMAQYFQRMQNYFAMMQQTMAMQRGMPMNPQMMQQMMQMQQMQQMQSQMMGGRGGGQNPQAMMNNMTPQMMQQMQQMQQQMMGAASPGGSTGSGQGGQGQGAGGFNEFNGNNPQQQQMFDQQGQPGQQVRQGSQGAQGGQGPQQAAYAMGGGQAPGGGPTSWEGMYDDVPQPNMPPMGPSRGGGFNRHRGGGGGHEPNHMAPANAPTGPKNAGKPGANYRGGGRGGGRGYHPYSRN